MAESANKTSFLSMIANKDAIMAFAVIGILMIMIVPLPTILLDTFLAMNICIAIIILLISLYLLKVLEFSIFPALLLVVTLFRLSLNVASTRLILLNGDQGTDAAGQVIKAFGQFVVGGNYVVGTIIFAILVIINFMVITKGSGRIAEVTARFTLDAMPGKQMAIDADLNAGMISEDEARERRLEIRREADFFGAMDGAAKFVSGDAKAGLIITLINIGAGFIIGVMQQGMSAAEAAATYTTLTVGDGLVSQIPALIISTASGIMVSRSAAEGSMGSDLVRQITAYPKVLSLTAVALLLFALIPGLPKLSFFSLAAIVGLVAFLINKQQVTEEEAQAEMVEREQEQAETASKDEPEAVEKLLVMDTLELEVGYALIALVDEAQGGDLLERIKLIRRQFAIDLGMVMPSIHIRDNLQLKPNSYSFKVKGNVVAEGEIMVGYCLAMGHDGSGSEIKGISTTEPAFGLPALWIEERQRERAQLAGYTVVDPSTVVATHLIEKIKLFLHELLSRQDVQKLVENLAQRYPKVVDDMVPSVVPWGTLQKVLQNLLREQVSIRDLMTIIETMADYSTQVRDVDVLTEYVRQDLSRTIIGGYLSEGNRLYVVTLEPALEEQVNASIQRTDHGAFLTLDPGIVYAMVDQFRTLQDKFDKVSAKPVLLCVPIVRFHLKRLLERFVPGLAVLSHNEVPSQVTVQALGRISNTPGGDSAG
ncbi:MAG: flagellar biosynthesis protein FlhA [Deltaproteobacteria bacterium]|nr:flagellar biosynthesis protein FlhA [Deltaproteobacteria bacterium]